MSARNRDADDGDATERLAAAGISPASPIADLESAVDADPSLAGAVIAILAERAEIDSAAALRRIEARPGLEKALRKEARRALYRLSSKGIVAPEAAPAHAAPRPALLAGPEPEAFLSPPDANGDRLFWLVKPRAGVLLHLTALVNEPRGLREAALAEVNRKAIRALRTELQSRHGLRMIDVDWRYADWIASEGYERARTATDVPESVAAFPQLRLQLFQRAAEPQPAPIDRFLDAESGAAPAPLASSAELFAEPDLRMWILPPESLAPWIRRYEEMRASPIVLDRFQQVSRVEELVTEAIREHFGGAHAASWRRRLDELAYVLWKTDRQEPARRARAAALAISSSDKGGTGIPFFEELARRSFNVWLAREAEREREEKRSSVLVTPEDLRAEQARTRRGGPLGR